MAAHSLSTKLLFLALAAAAADGIVGLHIRNGLFALVEAHMAVPQPLLPQLGPPVPLRTAYTGVAALDRPLAGVVMFYWTFVSAERPAVSLFAIYAVGQIVAVHGLLLLEGLRKGNRGKAISYSTAWATLYQFVPWGFLMPIYWALNLWSAPAARVSARTPRREARELLSMDATQLSVLPLSLTLGLVVPTVLAAVPLPGIGSLHQRQGFLALWQVFPALVGASQALLALLARATARSGGGAAPTAAGSLRGAYRFCLTVACLTHLGTMAFAAFPSLRPASLAFPDRPPVDLWSMMVPVSPLSGAAVKSLVEGTLDVLQYDMHYACGATLLWAVVMYASGSGAPSLSVLARALPLTLAFGPGGAAMALVAARDEKLLVSAVGPVTGDKVKANKAA